MKRLTLYLKITIFLLLMWMFQCFYNCDSYKTLIDKNILQTKNELKYERVLTEGDIAGKMQTYSEGILEECSLDNKKNKWENPVQNENPCDRWQRKTNRFLETIFNEKTSKMDPKWRDQKWNNEWNKISANKVNELSSIFHRSDISEEEKRKLIRSVKDELYLEFAKFLDECKKEMRDNKTESGSKKKMIEDKTECESNKEMTDNITESESMKEMRDNKTEYESSKVMRGNKTESESNNEIRDNKTESESRNEMTDNKTESESNKEMIDNKTESESKNEMTDNKTESESKNEMTDNKTECESKNEMTDNKTESESKKEMIDNKTHSESKMEQGKNKIKNKKSNILKFLFKRFDNH
ncbi:fam-g protein [Plasmodium gallinaceum]|uniref:Fam-g protein n=1 Tax=Plasmodium gallinaceum TaxID=5849 RepID=A0A1J1GU42_PLAGA|nr:fam-g protein [Plasmodium gallinaceum]CRG96046.1 fam-g protein [Plasmodium gallinaceum]